ncbi:alpha/beta-hydrolase [Lophiostoma macrostomum CBS 122681]|uniref:Alpha/beta-hydrolase n=1 Tax=Lophiostoma macrostomum CBS 122681 TaxID=1314788 RepID=A0A6A6T6U8_9PLEO|nr:alpha/beta-hydrolase [Lophiostoma macrostomum CBS 122681]
MAGSKSDIAVVVVQGCFQKPLVYEQLSGSIRKHGYQTFQPELPTCTEIESPGFAKKDLNDDTKVVRDVIEDLVEQKGRKVIVVMHSYGGLVGSNAVLEKWDLDKRQSLGLAGGVAHLFYFSAFIMGKGQSVLGTYGESPNNEEKDGKLYFKNGAKLLYNDLPEEEAALWASRMVPQSYAVQTTTITNAAYEFVPSTYVICDNDKAVPPQVQEIFSRAAGSHVERIDSGHSPMLSRKDKLVDIIVSVIEKSTS